MLRAKKKNQEKGPLPAWDWGVESYMKETQRKKSINSAYEPT